MPSFDYVLAGGGLQNGLIVLALRARRPSARIALVERESRLGGNHTWCFHDSDVDPDDMQWLEPLIRYRWDGYRVLFPAREHSVSGWYSGVSSERLHEVVTEAVRRHPESRLLLDTDVADVRADGITLASGEDVDATVVVDGRGPSAGHVPGTAGYQKFVGLEVELAQPHGLERPILMDATVDQSDGYRFFYVLPFDERTLLIEDTYFHDSPDLDRDRTRTEIRAYAAGRGWEVLRVLREEAGVLPMPWTGTFAPQRSGPLRAGYRGGWFHPGTGYSFPVAVRLARLVADRGPEELFGSALADLSREHAAQARYAQLLNRLMFRWYPPERRRSIFERFYRLPSETIRNFYALRLTTRDRARLLLGRPPPGLSLLHRFGGAGAEGRANEPVAGAPKG